jgi:hypothetical protein
MKAVARTLYGSVLGDSSSSLLWRPPLQFAIVSIARLGILHLEGAPPRLEVGLAKSSRKARRGGGDGAPQMMPPPLPPLPT